MPNPLPLYLYARYAQGVSVERMAAEVGMPVDQVRLRLEAARLCFDHQCILAVAE